MLKIISCAGFGNTGSSIITDFFQEFSCVKAVGGSFFEFQLLHEPDGIMDLEKSLVEGNRLKTDLAIKRFLKLVNMLNFKNLSGPNYKDFFGDKFLQYTKEYLKALGVIEWNHGWWSRAFELQKTNKIDRYVKQDMFNKLIKKHNYALYEADSWRPIYTSFTKQYFCISEKDEFKKITKLYLNKLFEILSDGAEYLLFDQLFPSNCDEDYISYFDFAKVIVVDRDPRDIYFANKVFWGSGYIPSENIETYIKWFRKTRNNVHPSSNLLCIKFEDMIYKGVETQKKICEFVGIDIEKHDKPKTHLILEKSKQNTMMYKRFDISKKEFKLGIEKDINRIEKELSDYIYPFEDFVDTTTIEKKKQEFVYEIVVNDIESRKYSLITIFHVLLKKIYNKLVK